MRESIMIIAGTRPEIIKFAPIFWELERRGIDYVFVWSGQHYDYELSRVFIEELKIPEPTFDIGVGSGSHATQTAKAMIGVEEAIHRYKPCLVMALGDTNTTLAAALTSVKMGITFAHIEAGLRSWNFAMPEEINRVIIDHISQILLTPSILASINLVAESISLARIFHVGNTIIDILNKAMEIIGKRSSEVVDDNIKDLVHEPYILVTVHRCENVDNLGRLKNIVHALLELSKQFKIVLPLHPRTRNRLFESGLLNKLKSNRNMILLRPLGYFNFLFLLKHTLVVLTDSGGVQEEAFTLRVPTVTLRYNTERPETVIAGGNVLSGADKEMIVEYTLKMIEYRDKIIHKLSRTPNPYGDGKASMRIVRVISEYLENPHEFKIHEPDLRDTPNIIYKLVEVKNVDPDTSEVVYYINSSKEITIEKSRAILALVKARLRILKPWENLGS